MTVTKNKILTVGLVLLAVSGVFGGMSYHQVPEGYTGVEKSQGEVTGNVFDSGSDLKNPFTTVQHVETSPRTYSMSDTQKDVEGTSMDAATVMTGSGLYVDVHITIQYRVESEKADDFVERWGSERRMESILIRPTVRTVLQDEASSLQTTGDNSIYTEQNCQKMEDAVSKALKEDFEDEPIVLEAVQIWNIYSTYTDQGPDSGCTAEN